MIKDPQYRFDTFEDGKILHNKKKGRLPAMGWNSWNAFGSGNTEELTKAMAEKLIELGLADLGYKYVVLDDGCYKPERVNGLLANEELKFPSGFRALADYMHRRGLKFGMYNDIGTNLCAGAAVGTCGHEEEDAKTYLSWAIDFLKVDNCYYLWDNATFSDEKNAKYVFAPNIRRLVLRRIDKTDSKDSDELIYLATEGTVTGDRISIRDDYVTGIGTWDGTGPDRTPVGVQSSELLIDINILEDGEYEIILEYATGEAEGVGSFVQMTLADVEKSESIYDDFVRPTQSTESFEENTITKHYFKKGIYQLRIMNHRRQENTLGSYGILLEALNRNDPDNDIILSVCEWGKTGPQNWGYKVGDSWRILNDITFQVGSDGDAGQGAWENDYTCSITSQYNKAVIMDEFAGLEKGWNDPDMMVIGMDGLSESMNRTHMTMWCMMNAPLMLGLDLRRISRGDEIWSIISNRQMIALNQDSLGIQAKRIYSTIKGETGAYDRDYIRDNKRGDVLAKPLADGSIAVSFINLDRDNAVEFPEISVDMIIEKIGNKMINPERYYSAKSLELTDLWNGKKTIVGGRSISAGKIPPCENITFRVEVKE